ncbi:MAG TPA: hypothetical protein VHC20_07995 [Candidatus Paceibacterota bacterium]|nr:hypothetical protein [Candidatus Paceibacterota bacterium]
MHDPRLKKVETSSTATRLLGMAGVVLVIVVIAFVALNMGGPKPATPAPAAQTTSSP